MAQSVQVGFYTNYAVMIYDGVIYLHFILLITFFSPIYIQVSSETVKSSNTLRLVQIIFRNGISTPKESYPNDLYRNNKEWTKGRNELTEKGKRAQFYLGKIIAKRYNELVNQTFQVETFTSDLNKTITSLDKVLDGLFSNNAHQNFRRKSSQVIFPADDNILSFSKVCSKYDKLRHDVSLTRKILKFLRDHHRILQFLSEKSGTEIRDLDDFLQLYSTLYDEFYSGKKLPSWIETFLNSGAIDEIINFALKFPTFTKELKLLKGGPLISKLLRNMDESLNATTPLKLIFFSGEAETLTTLLDCLDMFDGFLPTFSSAVILELYQNNESDSYFIKIYFNNDSGKSSDFNLLWIPRCGFFCPLEEFEEILSPLISSDYETECQTFMFPLKETVSAIVLLASFPILVVIFVKILERRRMHEEFPPLLNSHKIF